MTMRSWLRKLFARPVTRPRPSALPPYTTAAGPPGVRHPDAINYQPRLIPDSFVVPDEALDLVPAPLCHAARVTQKPSMPEEILR